MLTSFVLAVALGVTEPALELSYRVWTAEDGLPHSSVYGIEQTPDGYLWIATLDGLARFDGARMTVFNRSEVPEMSSNRLLCIRGSRDGSLWLGTEDGGVIHRGVDGRFRSYGLDDGLPSLFVAKLVEDAEGRMWAATPRALARFDDGRWIVPPGAMLRSGERIEAFSAAAWSDRRLRVLEPAGVVDYPRPPSGGGWEQSLFGDGGRRSWLRTGRRSFLLLEKGTQTPLEAPGVAETEVEPARWGAVRGADGRTWLLREGRLAMQDDGGWRVFDPATSPTLPPPIAMLEDREGCLWIGGDTGLVQAVPTPIRTIVPAGVASERSLYPIAEAADGRVWAGSWAALYTVDGGRFTRLDDLWRAVGVVLTIEPEPDGSVLLGCAGGKVHRVRTTGEVETVHTGPPSLDLLRDRAGAVWLAGEEGVIRVDRSGTTAFGQAQGLAGLPATVLLEGAEGAIWVGTHGGLSRIRGDEIRSWSEADGLPGGVIRALHEDDRGALWIGTYDGGLARLKDGKVVSIRKRDGLFDDGVFSIVDDGAGRFWMSGNRGISAVQRAELDAFADGKAPSVSHRAFGRADGMLSAECNGGYQSAGLRKKDDGTLWFPTQQGIVIVDPRRMRSNPIEPTVIIEEIASEHRKLEVGPEVVLEPSERRLDVRFTATSFVRPGQVRFRYFVEGLDDAWAEAGPDRQARLSFLPPGRYVFRVTASNSDGVWNEKGASVALVVRPAWWEAGWVRAGAILGVLGAATALVASRFARLRRRREEQDAFSRRLIAAQEAERKRIAGELHDGIGQTLAVIRNRAALGLRGDPASEKPRRQMEEIVDAATGAIDEIRRVAHDLRPYQLDRLGLSRTIEALLEQAASSSEIDLAWEIGSVDGVFPHGDEIHVFRIVQEAVGNLVRHSAARRARVAVVVSPHDVEITVEDDGRGFDPDSPPAGPGGTGLIGIAERVRILGGRRTIHSAPGRGTRVVVKLPRRSVEAG